MCVRSQQYWCLPVLDAKIRAMKKMQQSKHETTVQDNWRKTVISFEFENTNDIAWKTQYHNYRGYARENRVHWCDVRLNGQ